MWFCSLKPTSDQDMYGDIWKKVFFFLYSVKKPTKQKNNALYIYIKKKKTVENELKVYVKTGVNEEINFMIIQQNYILCEWDISK